MEVTTRVTVALLSTVTLLCHIAHAKSDFGILKNDSIFDGSTQGNKAFLKTRLLENLNNFFPSINNDERLEMLTGAKAEEREENEELVGNSVTDSPPPEYPTLIPFQPSNNPIDDLPIDTNSPTSKVRSEGKIVSETKLDSIRDWRKRLYKAFKNRSKISRIIRKTPADEVVEMNDVSPTIMDKNRQIILSRTEPNWQSGRHIQTYGRDPNGKLIPLFGIEPASLLVAEKEEQKVIEPYPPREIRYAYRTTHRQPVVYVPAAAPAPSNTIPVPVASYLANPSPQPIQLHILPPIPSQPAPQPQIIYQTTPAPSQFFTFSTFAPTSSMETQNQNQNQMTSCNNGNCQPESDDDKCNSQRLRTIIFNNIVSGDAEASKRAVQSAAEADTGLFFDAICGTGFFSYIAHTDEFCLASSGGVNCYVFAPICQGTDEQQRKKKMSKN